ncbi:MAG: zinc-dependent peptidase [Gammaproteobacteria bacterium]|nr:zinc-dependent peptidase [Gammaproteobacteria bacterium]
MQALAPIRLWRQWRRRRILDHCLIDAEIWWPVVESSPAASHLTDSDRWHLRDLASLFLHEKSIEPAGGLELADPMRSRIACEACIPILNLGLELYRNWYSVIVYPGEFIARHRYVDEAGVEHDEREARLGEAWEHGPVVISWEDVAAGEPGFNVIIHEMAHKLDLLDGATNGRPPLHADMEARVWTDALGSAYAEHERQVEAGLDTAIDPYAAEDPGEFFAVASEVFFESPELLRDVWPQVYAQLALYYRQNPAGAGP